MADITFAERGTKDIVEEGESLSPKFDKDGLITAIAIDHETKEILMVAYMNEQAFKETLELGYAVYWSRSRQKFWRKGEESGNVQNIKSISIDCDQDCLVMEVEQVGGAACHTGRRSCFYRQIDLDAAKEGHAKLIMTNNELIFDPKAVYGKK